MAGCCIFDADVPLDSRRTAGGWRSAMSPGGHQGAKGEGSEERPTRQRTAHASMTTLRSYTLEKLEQTLGADQRKRVLRLWGRQ